jgi:hypothetical protein
MPRDSLVVSVVAKAFDMIDCNARRTARALTMRLALGRMTNFEWENAFLALLSETKDPAIYAIFRTVRHVAGESESRVKHLFPRGSVMRDRLCRWLFFLSTNCEYSWPRTRLAPGVRDYRDHWLIRLFGFYFLEMSDDEFMRQGDYEVWPFKHIADFNEAKASCETRWLARQKV